MKNTDGNVISSARFEGNNAKYYSYNKDTRNSTSTLVGDNNVGIVAYRYNEFGETENLGNESMENEVCYTGQVYDKETENYYYNARYYSPDEGRFVTVDSYRGEFKEPLSLHLYAYCKNDPINYTNPSGHNAIWLLDKNGAPKKLWKFTVRFGHISALFGKKGEYYYTYWSGGNKASYWIPKGNAKSLSTINSYIKKNKYPISSGKKYQSGIKFYANFSKSLEYFDNRVMDTDYNYYSQNCMQTTVDALLKGTFTDKKGKKASKTRQKQIIATLKETRRKTSPKSADKHLKSHLKIRGLGNFYKNFK